MVKRVGNGTIFHAEVENICGWDEPFSISKKNLFADAPEPTQTATPRRRRFNDLPGSGIERVLTPRKNQNITLGLPTSSFFSPDVVEGGAMGAKIGAEAAGREAQRKSFATEKKPSRASSPLLSDRELPRLQTGCESDCALHMRHLSCAN
eukprot:1753979-Rhodomonas_salina.1